MTDFFTPNWKRNGFKSGEEAMMFAIGKLMEKRKILVRMGLGESLTMFYKGHMFTLEDKTAKKK